MDPKIIILLIYFSFSLVVVYMLFMKGKKALSIFPDISTQNVKFQDITAIGKSTDTTKRKGGHPKSKLELIITDSELWIKSKLSTAFITTNRDAIHKIPLKNIIKISKEDNTILLDFKTTSDVNKQVALDTNNSEEFLNVLKEQMNNNN